jgi:hypothetical protein
MHIFKGLLSINLPNHMTCFEWGGCVSMCGSLQETLSGDILPSPMETMR